MRPNRPAAAARCLSLLALLVSVFHLGLGGFSALVAGAAPYVGAPAVAAGTFAAPPPPSVSAAAAYVVDATVGTELYALNPDERRAPASLTKIATALVVLEHADLDDTVTIDPADVVDTSQSRVDLIPGDALTVLDLLYGLLVQSGNDAALALARHVGAGLPDPGTGAGADPVAAFVAEMNRLAGSLHLENTHFVNPTGLDDEQQYASARDLAVLTARALQNPTFAEIVATPSATLASTLRPEGYPVFTTNDLLLEGLVQGVKTGSTSKAGGCLIAVTRMEENQVIAVVLGSPMEYDENGFPRSPARFESVRKILAAIPGDYQWSDPTRRGLLDGLAEELDVWEAALPPGPPIVVPTARADQLRYRLQLGPPGKPNEEVGRVLFFVGSDLLSERPVLQAADPGGAGSAPSDLAISGSA